MKYTVAINSKTLKMNVRDLANYLQEHAPKKKDK